MGGKEKILATPSLRETWKQVRSLGSRWKHDWTCLSLLPRTYPLSREHLVFPDLSLPFTRALFVSFNFAPEVLAVDGDPLFQAELKSVSSHNLSQLRRLLKAAKEEMIRQELRNKLQVNVLIIFFKAP